MTQQLIPYEQPAGIDLMRLGDVLSKSQYFQDAKDAAQAIVKVLAGQELGIGPIAAMTGLYIVKGRVTMSANLMAAQIKRSDKYNYQISQLDDTGCEIIFFEQGREIGRSRFTEADAKAAGLWGSSDPWKKTPRNMLFARAMSNGAKWYTPDVFSGPVYTPDELRAEPDITPALPPAPAANPVTGEVVAPAEPPAPAQPDPLRAGLIIEMRDLTAKARAAGFTVPPMVPKTMTTEQIEAAIRELQATVEPAAPLEPAA